MIKRGAGASQIGSRPLFRKCAPLQIKPCMTMMMIRDGRGHFVEENLISEASKSQTKQT